jgi:hypothetical protein
VRPRGRGSGARRAAGLVGLAAATAAGCAPNDLDEAGPLAGDTVRGVVEIVGAEPITGVRLATADGPVPLSGPVADQLRPATGAEVWVRGARSEDGPFRVESFAVRAVDGVEAVDGVLELDGDAAVVVTRAGDRVRFSPAPAGLRRLEGRHVWVAAPPGSEPRSWGLLEPDP